MRPSQRGDIPHEPCVVQVQVLKMPEAANGTKWLASEIPAREPQRCDSTSLTEYAHGVAGVVCQLEAPPQKNMLQSSFFSCR